MCVTGMFGLAEQLRAHKQKVVSSSSVSAYVLCTQGTLPYLFSPPRSVDRELFRENVRI